MSTEAKPEAIDIATENQDLEAGTIEKKDEIKAGDKVFFSNFYKGILRGNAKLKAADAEMEVIGVTERSITTRPWGSEQKYGPQFERRYITKVKGT